jgi:hypothetical protein
MKTKIFAYRTKKILLIETHIKIPSILPIWIVSERTYNRAETTVVKTLQQALQDHSKVLSQLQNRKTNNELDSLKK